MTNADLLSVIGRLTDAPDEFALITLLRDLSCQFSDKEAGTVFRVALCKLSRLVREREQREHSEAAAATFEKAALSKTSPRAQLSAE